MPALIKYSDVEQFRGDVTAFLEKDEVINGLALGILRSLEPEMIPDLMAAVVKDDHILAVLLQTHPCQIIVSVHPEESRAEEIAELICREISSIPGLIGVQSFTSKLAAHIELINGQPYSAKMNQRIYRLDRVRKEANKDGRLCLIGIKDMPLVKEWVEGFCEDTGTDLISGGAEEQAALMIGRGRLYGWEVDGKIVSMANAARPTANNITINSVYTPPEHRKKGYASSCVSALTQLMLDHGYSTTSLYTDLDNPTSNKIYMEIGYVPVADSVLLRADSQDGDY